MIGRAQSLLTVALVLTVPLSGLLVMDQLREALVSMRPQLQQTTNERLAAQLPATTLPTPPAPGTGVAVLEPPHALTTDGFADDWRDWHAIHSRRFDDGSQLRLARDSLFLHGLQSLPDTTKRWTFWPDASQAEQSLSVTVAGDGSLGRIEPTPLSQRVQIVQAPGPSQRLLEWRVPRQLLGTSIAWQINDEPRQTAQPLIPSQELITAMTHLLGQNQRLWLTDADGTPLAVVGNVHSQPTPWWLGSLTRAWLLSDAVTAWSGWPGPAPQASQRPWVEVDGELRLITHQAVNDAPGWQLLLEAPSQLEKTLNPTALGALGLMAITGFLLAPLGLVVSAARLRHRIDTLRRASQRAQRTPESRLPVGPAGDMLDQLASQFNRLLDRQAEQRDYLEQLGARLAHEMRTPLTAARSSLQRLSPPQAEDAALVQRADSNLARLSRLLQAMSESRRLEDSLAHAEWAQLDLNELAVNLLAASAESDPQRRYRPVVSQSPTLAHCAPDLLVLALEKLLANAREFTPAGGRIHLRVQPLGQQVELRLSNTGSRLPEGEPARLFENLVSHRDNDDGLPHLGLGLYLVRLVAEHHGGHVEAANTEDGVCIILRLKRYP